MEAYPAHLQSPAKSEKSRARRPFYPQLRRTAAAGIMRDSLPDEGSNGIFTFGQRKGMTYEGVLYRTQKCPSVGLADFLAWVTDRIL